MWIPIRRLARPRLRHPCGARVFASTVDHLVVGHEEAKEGLYLAFLAREHVLLAGPVGTAKSMLAEHFATSLGQKPCILQLHRDTRAEDLISSAGVLKRTPLGVGHGEVLSFVQMPGQLLESDVCVLDDLNNAPGEALSSLLGALTRQDTPLRTAVATTNETEVLDPALVDRFAVQLQLTSSIYAGKWTNASSLLGTEPEPLSPPPRPLAFDARLKPPDIEVESVPIPGAVQQLFLKVLKQLVLACQSDSGNQTWELSDRFLVKALRMIRAHALFKGRSSCEAQDLFALRFLTAFRVPWPVHLRLLDIIRSVLDEAEAEAKAEKPGDWATMPTEGEEVGEARPYQDGVQSEQVEGKDAGGQSVEASEGVEGGDSTGSGSGRQSGDQQGEEAADCSTGDGMEQFQRREDEKVVQHASDANSQGEGTGQNPGAAEAAGQLKVPEDLLAANMGLLDVDSLSVKNIEHLLECITGSIDRGRSELAEHPGGAPRRYKRWDPRDMGDFAEVDPLELHTWAMNPSPAVWPRCRERLKRCKGGLVAILRDVSMSMAGVNATWSSRVTMGLIEACRERDMSFGYIEFNHHSKKFRNADGSFFSTDYDSLSSLAMRLQCNGWTNYSKPLQEVLHEFFAFTEKKGGSKPLKGQAHVLLITDGIPTHGDPDAQQERLLAKQLGIVIHTVYLGWPQGYPKALSALSDGTGGRQFAAFYQPESPQERKERLQPRQRVRNGHGVGLDSGFICVVERDGHR